MEPVVTLNGKVLEVEFDGMSSFSDIIESVAKAHLGDDEMILEIAINGEPLNGSSISSVGAKPISEIKAVSLITKSDAGEHVAELLSRIGEYLNQLAPGLQEVSNMLRTGGVEKANAMLVDALDGLTSFLELLDISKKIMEEGASDKIVNADGESLNSVEIRFTKILKDIMDGQEAEDWVTVADLLEYELSPVIEEWRDFIPQMKGSIKS